MGRFVHFGRQQMIRFTCEACGKSLNVADKLAGKRGKCPGCGGVVNVPGPGAPPPDAQCAASPQPQPPGPQDPLSMMAATAPAPPPRTAASPADRLDCDTKTVLRPLYRAKGWLMFSGILVIIGGGLYMVMAVLGLMAQVAARGQGPQLLLPLLFVLIGGVALWIGIMAVQASASFAKAARSGSRASARRATGKLAALITTVAVVQLIGVVLGVAGFGIAMAVGMARF